MNWCCPAFEGWHQESGKRGLGVFVDDSGYGDVKPIFVLQFRAVDAGINLPAIGISDSQTLVSTVVDVAIQYCPWCGRRLSKWYKKDWPRMAKPELRTPLGKK